MSISPKIKIHTTPLFFKIDLCSATSMESSRHDLSNDVAEHRPGLKYIQITHCYCVIFTPKAGMAFPKKTALFSLCSKRLIFLNDYETMKKNCQDL